MTNADKTTPNVTNAAKVSSPVANIWDGTNTPWDPEDGQPWDDETTIETNTTFTNQDKL